MNFRRRILLVLALTVFFTVGAVTWAVLVRTRQAFFRADTERTDAIVSQFRHEFTRRGDDVVRAVDAIAAGDTATRIALDLNRGGDTSAYIGEAKAVADSRGLELLEFVGPDAAIISSAQWPARFGYKASLPLDVARNQAFLAQVPLPDGPVLGLVAVRAVRIGEAPLFVVGGTRVDRAFVASLALPTGMRALLYRSSDAVPSASDFITPSGAMDHPEKLSALVARVRQTGAEQNETVFWSANAADSERFHAIPLKGPDGNLLGAFLIGSSRRGVIDLQRNIAVFALIVGGAGILFAIILSAWMAARVTRPVEHLATAAQEVAAGNWDTRVVVGSNDELGQLAASFNAMTLQLVSQRDRLVQSERVAAWRELARRLAHELKNPLFPLQITVENLVRARQAEPALFDEVFRESTATLLAEVTNLKTIIGRFSDFSKMPQPQLQAVNLNELLRNILVLYAAQFAAPERPRIETRFDADNSLGSIEADPDLLHRAFSNLVLNALDAMPQGGRLTVRTSALPGAVRIDVQDTGSGLTREECERLFTPYYTSKQHGTGLGLAIVQSVISDHRGSITVDSAPGQGTTFHIELPRPSRDDSRDNLQLSTLS